MNKWIGSYKVIKTIRTRAYKLHVLEGTWCHNVIHTTLLKQFQTGDDPQEMDKDNNNEIYKVKTILNFRKYPGVVKYRIRWKGYNELGDT